MFEIGNEELEKLDDVKKGDLIKCRICGKRHKLKLAINLISGLEDNTLGFIKCGKNTLLASVSGKLIKFKEKTT